MKSFRAAIVFVFLFGGAGFAQAEVKFTPGGSLRLRHEFLKNIYDFENSNKDNQNYFRVRYSFSGKTDFNENVSVFAKLTDEFKWYADKYYSVAGVKQDTHFDVGETIIDNLYVDVKNLFGAPVDMRLGRQDFLNMYGEGFLIQDGTPIDGSRTYYFNAFKTSWKANDENILDYIYINNPRYDTWFPVINENDPPRTLNVTSEEAYVLYWKNKGIDKLALEPFYIYKREDNSDGSKAQAQKGRINTPGVYAKYDLSPYILRGQYAYQTGNYGVNDREAMGGYFFVDRLFNDKQWKPKITSGYIYLSGNDPSTAKNEGWDPLFSRYPWMSELYCLSYNTESGLSYWTNLQMWQIKSEITPTEKLKVEAAYNFLRANERATGTYFGDGKNRGHLPQCKVTYTFNQSVSTYLLAEYLLPGNFYTEGADPALFLRSEFMIKF